MTDKEIGKRVRLAKKGLRIKPRRLYDPQWRDGYRESDSDFLANNRDVAVAILEALLEKKT